jgi:hypothetical protein
VASAGRSVPNTSRSTSANGQHLKTSTQPDYVGFVVLAACSIMAGVVTFLMGHDAKIEMVGSRVIAE